MSWLGRILGRAPAASPAPSPPSNAVVVPDDIAAVLTAGGTSLAEAVERALRAHVDAAARQLEREGRVPFWLARDAEDRARIEDELRDRMAQRKTAEEAEGDTARSRGRGARDVS